VCPSGVGCACVGDRYFLCNVDMGKKSKSSTNLGRSLIKNRFGSANRTRNKDPSLVYYTCPRINVKVSSYLVVQVSCNYGSILYFNKFTFSSFIIFIGCHCLLLASYSRYR
jgi:hypothetical protein